MTIQSPGYKPIFDNAVYVKDKEITEDGQQMLLKCLILPKKYTAATEDQVVEYLRQKAGELAGASLALPDGCVSHKSLLEKVIQDLPEEIKTDLRTGDEPCIKFVRRHTPAPVLEDGESPDQYLHIRYGLLPAELITENQEGGAITDAGWYDTALSHDSLREMGLGERWHMEIWLYNGALPEKAEMDTLLKHGTYGSKTLDISRIHYNPEEVREVIEAIYTGLSKPEPTPSTSQ